VSVQTYRGDVPLAYALNNSMAPLPFLYPTRFQQNSQKRYFECDTNASEARMCDGEGVSDVLLPSVGQLVLQGQLLAGLQRQLRGVLAARLRLLAEGRVKVEQVRRDLELAVVRLLASAHCPAALHLEPQMSKYDEFCTIALI